MKTINEIVTEVYENAKDKGWHEQPRSALEIHMLIVSEIAEATEAVRNNIAPMMYDESGKPEGEIIELADAVIRIMDYFGSKGWDLENAISIKHDYNKHRPYRHGGKVI